MTTKRPSRRRRLLRFLACGLLVLLAAACALFTFQGPILRRFVLPGVEAALGEALGLDVSVGDARIDPRGRLRVFRLEAGGPAPRSGLRALAFREAVVSISPSRLLRGLEGWLDKVELEEPRIELDLSRDPVLPAPGGGAAAKPAGEESPAPHSPLPVIQARGAAIRILTQVDDLRLGGVDLDYSGGRVHLSVASASGEWSPPRASALRFPLELDATLAGEREPWRRILLERVLLAGREAVRDLRVDLADLGEVRLAGDFPAWGVRLTSGSVAGGLLDLNFRAEGADLRAVVSLFTAWPCPAGRGTGDFRLLVPLGREDDWRVSTDMELTGVSWPEEGLRADLVQANLHRGGAGLVLEGDAVAAGVAWRGLPPVDVAGRFRREADSPAEEGFRIALDDVVIRSGEAEAAVSFVLRERGLRVERGSLRVSRLTAAELVRLGMLPPPLEAIGGTMELDASFLGGLEDPSSLDAAGRLRVEGLCGSKDPAAGGGEAAADLSADASLAACQLRLERGTLRRCDDEVRFSLSAGAQAPLWPLLAAFDRLAGRVGGFAFEAVEPPFIEAGEGWFRAEPFAVAFSGGALAAAAGAGGPGGVAAWFSAKDFDLSALRDLAPDLEPGGTLSLEAAFASRAGEGGAGPLLEADCRVAGGRVTLAGERIEGLEASSRVEVTEDALDVRELRLSRGADRASLSASVPVAWRPLPLPLAGAPYEVQLGADIAEAARLPARATGFRELAGRIVVSAAARGRVPGDPRDAAASLDVRGLVSVLGGRAKRFDDFPPITDLDAELRFENGAVAVESLAGKVYDSRFTVTGDLAVSLPWEAGGAGIHRVDMRLVSNGALLIRRPELRVRGDLDLRWAGPWEASRLEGDVSITRAYYLEDISLTPSRRARLPLKLFAFKEAPLDALRLNVRLRSNRGITVKNNLVSTRATADLLLVGTGAEPLLSGTISTDEGIVRLADASLKLRSSLIELLPEDPLNPRLQIGLGETIRGYSVTVSITGTLDEPEVLLDSSPPLERERVLVLITTGLTLEEIEEQGVSRVAAVKAAKYVGLRIARYFSKGDPTDRSFLDRFSLETESAKSAREEDPIRVEYRLIEGLIREHDELYLQGERDNYGDYNFNLGVRFELD